MSDRLTIDRITEVVSKPCPESAELVVTEIESLRAQIKRYLALADECKQKAEAMVKDRAYELGSDVTLEWVEKRIREIAEGRE